MRLIDAEKCPCKGCPIEYCYQNCEKYYAWLEGCDYDVETVVAALEELEKEKLEMYDWSGQTAVLEAISIVRGKE